MKQQTPLLYLILMGWLFWGFNNHTQTMTDSHNRLTERMSDLLDSIYKLHPETRGMVIHVEAPKYHISWHKAAGFADTKGRKLTPEMPANIASNTKTYIAATILRLVELGKLETTDPIGNVISESSNKLLTQAGYNTRNITVAHLLTNTSGIYDFVNTQTYQNLTQSNPKHRWTRDEQIALAVQPGTHVVGVGEVFAYSETNYSLLTEIIERKTKLPFHIAVRRLLKFDALKLNSTWFLLQEKQPAEMESLVEQTATAYNVNSYTLDYSFDAFGGGGLASTVKDLALFSQCLFSGAIFDKPSTKELLYTTVPTKDGMAPTYSYGLMHTIVAGYKAYGHGGFWGTQVKYIPELDVSIAVFVMERDTWQVYNILIEEVVKEMLKHKSDSHPKGDR